MSSSRTSSSLKLPLKVRILLALNSVGIHTACRPNHTVNRSLSSVFDPVAPASSKPVDGVSSHDTQIDASRNLWFRLYKPHNAKDAEGLPLLVYYHGGGFCFHSARSKFFDHLCRKFAREIPAVVVSVNYRLAPEHKYPIQYEDGFEALRFIDGIDFSSLQPLKVDFGRCFISGDSAGGNLAHHVVVKAAKERMSSFKNISIKGLISIMPFFGGEERTGAEIRNEGGPILPRETTDWFWKAFLPEGADKNHQAANVFGANGEELSGIKYPDTLLVVGGYDPLWDWQKRYYEGLVKKLRVKVKLVEYPNVTHGFYAFSQFSETSLMVDEMKDFVHKTL